MSSQIQHHRRMHKKRLANSIKRDNVEKSHLQSLDQRQADRNLGPGGGYDPYSPYDSASDSNSLSASSTRFSRASATASPTHATFVTPSSTRVYLYPTTTSDYFNNEESIFHLPTWLFPPLPSSTRLFLTFPTTSSSSTTLSSSTSTTETPSTATMVVYATASVPSTTTPSPTSTSTSAKSSSGPGAGPIIGIVAGALLGVVALTGLIGYFFKKYNKRQDPFEGNPFDRDTMRRHSAMIPDHYDDDDEHHMDPSMSEHNPFGGVSYENGLTAASAAGGAGAAAMMAHNEAGGPRPPTMFTRHANGPAAQMDMMQQQAFNGAPLPPQVGACYRPDGAMPEYGMMHNIPALDHGMDYAPPTAVFGNRHLDDSGSSQPPQRSVSPAPQLPPLAAFGGDPYSIAGVGRNISNIANPYAQLERGQPASPTQQAPPPPSYPSPSQSGNRPSSGSTHGSADQHGQLEHQRNSAAAEALVAGLAHQAMLQQQQQPSPNGSNSMSSYHQRPQPPSSFAAEESFDTQGRPHTSEGRSGTPVIPNVQQTYAVVSGSTVTRVSSIAGGSLLDPAIRRVSGSSQEMLTNPHHNHFSSSNVAHHQPTSPAGSPFNLTDPFANPHTASHHNPQQTLAPLSVRNLTPASAAAASGHPLRPISTASSFADPEDAYGGVY